MMCMINMIVTKYNENGLISIFLPHGRVFSFPQSKDIKSLSLAHFSVFFSSKFYSNILMQRARVLRRVELVIKSKCTKGAAYLSFV